ncbi:MAG TPA: DUF2283 domain-containing protein [Clostridia bacterium]|nr:DUF2283 domain-containing protein [Clostridia bacterium]
MVKIKYDEQYDILYVALSDMGTSYGNEDPDGVVVHRDMRTKEVTGVTIFEFRKRVMGQVDWPIILPNNISFEKDIAPYLH